MAHGTLIPERGALLGIDYGTKRVGVALSTPDRVMASPLEIYLRRDAQQDARYFQAIVNDYRVVGLVVGLPVHVAGHESAKSREARDYGGWLSKVTGLPILFWDERYTSSVAEDHLLTADLTRRQRKGRLDKVAAQIMLQACLDHHRPRSSGGESSNLETDPPITVTDESVPDLPDAL